MSKLPAYLNIGHWAMFMSILNKIEKVLRGVQVQSREKTQEVRENWSQQL